MDYEYLVNQAIDIAMAGEYEQLKELLILFGDKINELESRLDSLKEVIK